MLKRQHARDMMRGRLRLFQVSLNSNIDLPLARPPFEISRMSGIYVLHLAQRIVSQAGGEGACVHRSQLDRLPFSLDSNKENPHIVWGFFTKEQSQSPFLERLIFLHESAVHD